jgi:ankyrin repeat protein
MEQLIVAGADVNCARITDGATPLSIALFKAADLHVVERLNAVRMDVNAHGPTPSPLHVAALWGRVQVVERLMAAGADLNVALVDGDTPLGTALTYRNTGFAQMLREVGALGCQER